MARICGVSQTRRLAWAGFLSFGPGVILAGIVLSLLEVAIVERSGGRSIPVHILFTLLFVPAVFLVAGIGGLALGIALRQTILAVRLALGGGLAAALAFLAVDLLMDAPAGGWALPARRNGYHADRDDGWKPGSGIGWWRDDRYLPLVIPKSSHSSYSREESELSGRLKIKFPPTFLRR
jgi:hypothetical protein